VEPVPGSRLVNLHPRKMRPAGRIFVSEATGSEKAVQQAHIHDAGGSTCGTERINKAGAPQRHLTLLWEKQKAPHGRLFKNTPPRGGAFYDQAMRRRREGNGKALTLLELTKRGAWGAARSNSATSASALACAPVRLDSKARRVCWAICATKF